MSIRVSLLLCVFFMSGGVSSCIEKERQALLDVKASLIYMQGSLYNWGIQEEPDCCNWVGVSCNLTTGHVTELDFAFSMDVMNAPKYGIRGKISSLLRVLIQLQYLDMSYIDFHSNPMPNLLASLSNLQTLCISGANLSGPISHQLVNLSNLLHVLIQLQYLDMSYIDCHSNPIPNLLASLSNLQTLCISGANLSGPISHQLVNLSNLLHLDLSNNSLWGSIPFFLGDLTSLTYLDLLQNQLGGVIPKTFRNSSSLLHLDLSQNLLNGSLPSVVRCSSLVNMSLAHNSISGGMPNFVGCTSLQNLDLSGNRISGNIPYSLGKVTNLRFLDLSSNYLEGVITEVHLLNLTQLRYLDLSSNFLALNLSFHGKIPFQLSTIKLQSCRLGPEFPAWIKTQRKFKYIDISNAGISCSIPNWFWDLPVELEFLNVSSNEIGGMIPNITSSFDGYPGMDLSSNNFEGRVPLLPYALATLNLSRNRFLGTLSFLCEVGGALTFLDLSNNSFSGSLPDCWWRFQERLVILNLSNNNLSGEIPSSLGRLSNLEALYLQRNAFVGELPMSLRNCRRLRFTYLGENNLFGVIPEWIGEELSELYVLVLGSNKFSGRLPSQLCWLYNLQVLDLSNNGLNGSIPRCFDNFTSMARKKL